MSDHFLVVIPAEPNTPLPETAESIRDLLGRIIGTEETRVKDYGKLQFIDCGENFERISCPRCACVITIDQWHDWMEEDWHGEEGFHLHTHETPCCKTSLTLNELIYEWPQGFARWLIAARNEGRGPLTPEELARLEAVAGHKLTAITQMY